MDREGEGGLSAARVLGLGLAFGVAFNVLGWLGNNLLLGEDWDAANAAVKTGFAAPWPNLVRELATLVSDFVYAFAFVWLFANARRQTVVFAVLLALVLWTAGVALLYLVLVNSGFLPAGVAVKTSLLALVIFVAAAPVLVALARRRPGGPSRQAFDPPAAAA